MPAMSPAVMLPVDVVPTASVIPILRPALKAMPLAMSWTAPAPAVLPGINSVRTGVAVPSVGSEVVLKNLKKRGAALVLKMA